MITKGFGEVINPDVFYNMSLDEYIAAYSDVGHYKYMPVETKRQTMIDDYNLIQSGNKKVRKGQKDPE